MSEQQWDPYILYPSSKDAPHETPSSVHSGIMNPEDSGISRGTEKPRGNERGSIEVKAAIALGKLIGKALLIGTPVLAGAAVGAASTAPDVMAGYVHSDEPSRVQVHETKIEQELCIANAIVEVNAKLNFEGRPLDQDIKGKLFGLVDYNFNLERNYYADIFRKVRYCMKGMSIPYEYDPNIAFGNPDQPAITAELKLSELIVVVSALNDKRNDYHSTSDGVLGYFASDWNKWLTQEVTQRALPEGMARDLNVQEKVDTIMNGVLNSYIDREAAVRCLAAGEGFDWKDSIIGRLLIDAAKAAIMQDFLNEDNNRPQPSADDISFKLIDDVTIGDTTEIMNKPTNDDNESAASLLTKPYGDGAEHSIEVAGFTIPIHYVLNPPSSSKGTCIITPDQAATGLTAGDKGEG